MKNKIFIFLIGVIFLLSLTFISSAQILGESSKFLRWGTSILGNESFLYEISSIKNSEICINPKERDLKNIEIEDEESKIKTIYKYKELNVYLKIDKSIKKGIKNLDERNTKGEFCFELNPLESLFYKIGEDSIIISAETGYNSTDINITQENKFAHLNISDPSLVLYLPFDVNYTENNITYDYTNYSNDLTFNGAPIPRFNESGRYGGSYHFGNVNSTMLITNKESLNPKKEITVSFWINHVNPDCDANNNYRQIMRADDAIFDIGYNIIIEQSGSLVFRTANNTIDAPGASEESVATDPISYNNWTHIVFIADINNLRHLSYKNGVLNRNESLIRNYSNGIGYTGDSFIINGGSNGGACPNQNGKMDGYLDEFMIFNRTLSTIEIQQIYNSTYQRFYGEGEVVIKDLNFGGDTVINLSISNCQKINGSDISFKLNNGGYEYLNNCSYENYNLSGDLTDANLTIRFESNEDKFYSSIMEGNLTIEGSRPEPNITFESPTLENDSYSNVQNQTIIANVSSTGNTSSWIDFNRSLVGYWAMDYYNDTGVFDNSSHNRFAYFIGTTEMNTTNIQEGIRGNGLKIYPNVSAGVSGIIRVNSGNEPVNQYNSEWTFSTWIYNQNYTSYGGGTTKRPAHLFGYNGWLQLGANSYINFNINYKNSTGTNRDISNTAQFISINEWNHVAGSFIVINETAFNISLYTNGILRTYTVVANANTSLGNGAVLPYNARHFEIGGDTGYPQFNYLKLNGSMDEFMVFNRKLSNEEILSIYNSQANKFNITLTNLSEGEYNYTIYSVDENGGRNSSTRFFTIDLTPPTFINEFVNWTLKGFPTLFGITINDNYKLENDGIWIMSTNNSGAWANESEYNFTSTPDTTSNIIVLNDTPYLPIGYRWYAKDEAGNWGSSGVYTLETTYPSWINPNPFNGTKSCFAYNSNKGGKFGYNYLKITPTNCTR